LGTDNQVLTGLVTNGPKSKNIIGPYETTPRPFWDTDHIRALPGSLAFLKMGSVGGTLSINKPPPSIPKENETKYQIYIQN